MGYKQYFVYLMTNFERTVLYTGVSNSLEGWTRAKKSALVKAANPEWRDLAADWYQAPEKVLRSAQDDTTP